MSTMFADDDLLAIRHLNDLLFCERRAALHLNEQLWQHNQYTVEGIHSHQRVDRPRKSKSSQRVTTSSVWLVSRRLGLIGKADTVEFHPPEVQTALPADATPTPATPWEPASVPAGFRSLGSEAIRGLVPFPVEFKRGRRRRWDNDDVQLCAQALCLEEMLGVAVPHGAIFHVKSRQRRDVVFDAQLRRKTEAAVQRLRELVTQGITPLAKYAKKCDGCSLKELCLPKALRPRATASRYLAQLIASPDDAESPSDSPADEP
jgi:CRISPR-associated exonuclease Cas4